MQAEALLNALAYTQAEMQPEKFGETLADLKGIAFTILKLKTNKLVDALGDVQAKALVDTLAQMVAELEANTLGAKFCPLHPESPVETLTDTC